MKLRALIDHVPSPHHNVEIEGLSSDSRLIKDHFIFFALAGTKARGADFIKDAIQRGASVIVGDESAPRDLPVSVIYLQNQDARLALAKVASRFYPRQPETIVAVTGTAGKSSVADFTRQIFSKNGHRAASLGTIGITREDRIDYGALTTPDPVSLHEILQALHDEGITHLAMEASSHGLDQKRLDGVRLTAAAFTNLGHDHLDYHGTREAYLQAKLRLFDPLLPKGSPAVINADSDDAATITEKARHRGLEIFSVGRAGHTITLKAARLEGFDQIISLDHSGDHYEITLPLVGEFQISNTLVAAGLALSTGLKAGPVFDALSSLRGVKGRLERVGVHKGGLIIIDYAHKPDALKAVLETMRPFAEGRLICLFGCGGDRDKEKRALMGTIAHQNADITIVTDDNPRSEDAALIRRTILSAAPGALEIADRRDAIQAGIDMLQKGDVLVIAGKGHETGQIIGDKILPFSDHEVVAACLDKGVRA
ncbi:MAG: UDP-N-acetylmuramoyl-L-alanyl-D-glutamate--2,6-diaminopimelate ligase [Hyphomicrobiales bacterium]